MTNRRFILGIVALVVLGAGRAQAATPEAEQEARRVFERAEEHFNAGLFAEALVEYRAGYELLPLPGFLINIAQCQRRMGDLAQARATYAKFIMVAPDSPYVDEVKALIAELDRVIQASATDTAAGPSAAATEESEAASLSPPPVRAQALPSGAPPDGPAQAALVAPPDLPPAPARPSTRWWLWGSIGTAVVAGALVTAYFVRSPETTTLHEGSLGTLRR
jgi:tetratricopeptide (TPR) repeat protein